MDALDFRGDVIAGYPPLTEPGAIAIAPGIMTLDAAGRALYRKWLSKWTDHTGRIITPAEHARRLEVSRNPPALRSAYVVGADAFERAATERMCLALAVQSGARHRCLNLAIDGGYSDTG